MTSDPSSRPSPAQPAPPAQRADPRPRVTVIIIFLNAGRFLTEAIDSVLAQTYPGWELLLVDDGSTDESANIARTFASRFPDRVRCLTHPGGENRGMSASRNLGIEHARGEYIAFLDADDVWVPGKLAEQLAAFEDHPEAGMVYGRTIMWHGWTGRPEDQGRDHVYDLGVPPETLVHPPRLFLQLLRNRAQTPTTCNAIVRRDLIRRIGGFEVDFRGMYEDQVFFAKVLLQTPVFVSGACWARYRQHDDNSSAERGGRIGYLKARRPFLSWLVDYVREHPAGVDDVTLHALRREAWAARHPYLFAVLERLRRSWCRLVVRRSAGTRAAGVARGEPGTR